MHNNYKINNNSNSYTIILKKLCVFTILNDYCCFVNVSNSNIASVPSSSTLVRGGINATSKNTLMVSERQVERERE